jgi:quercetin dioxygenase-like cupin family protein
MSDDDRSVTVVRLAGLTPATKNPPDMKLHRYRRDRYQVVGRPGERLPGTAGADVAANINFGYMRSPPGAGNCSHAHPRWEIFIPLSGQWRLAVEGGPLDERYELELGPLDMIVLPPDVFHEATNIGDEDGWLMSINPGVKGEPYRIHPSVIQELKAVSEQAGDAAQQGRDI